MGVSISTGHAVEYLTGQVAQGRESYYLDATTAGEAPGRWAGKGAAKLGLTGEVKEEIMQALYAKGLDPRDPRFWDEATRDQADKFGKGGRAYRSAHEIVVEKLTADGRISPERLAALRAEAKATGQTEKLAQGRLEVLLGQERGMLPEDVSAVRAEAERTERQNVAFIDVTYSPPKSVTAARVAFERAELDAQRAAERAEDPTEKAHWTAEAQRFAGLKNTVINAVQAGADKSLAVMEEKAGYSRVGRNGMRSIDTEGLIAAQFYQTDSRDGDPQDHVHQAILNKVVCSDGEVRTLDSKAIHDWKQAAGTAGEREMFEKLADAGFRSEMRPDGVARELVDVPEATRDLFSDRSKSPKFTKAVESKVEAYKARFGREPSRYELDQMRRDASMATRKAKSHEGQTKEEQLDKWEQKHREGLGQTLTGLAHKLADGREVVEAQDFSPDAVKRQALAAVQEGRSAWSRSELYRQVELALPARLGTERAHEVVDQLTDEIIREVEQITGATPAATVPEDLKLANGKSAYARPGGPRYASQAHLELEERMLAAAQRGGRLAVEPARVQEWIAAKADWMTESQKAALVGIMSHGAAVSTLVGPAGAGKSTVCGALSECWSDLTGGRVVGLAKSQIATEVLIEDGVRAVNIDTWLGMQRRAGQGRPQGEDLKYEIRPTDLIIIDESSMAETTAVDAVRGHVERVQGRTVLAGDPAQLSSVDAGGVMSMLVNGAAPTYTLTEVMRFKNADGSQRTWAAKASLDLRDGKPEGLAEYNRRGALRDAGTRENAEREVARGYLGDTARGLRSLAILPTNEGAARVSGAIREQLVKRGQVEAEGVQLGLDGNVAGKGDLVMARENDWQSGLTNRRRYVVEEVRPDGSLVAKREDNGKPVVIGPEYVASKLQLGYAGTVHSGQGLTVDTCHSSHEGKGDGAGLLVPLTRGVLNNTMHVVTQPEVEGESTGETHQRERRSVMSVLGDALERDRIEQQTALAQRAEDARQARSMETVAAWTEAGVQDICRQRLDRWLDNMVVDGAITEAHREQLAADPATESVSRLLRAVEQAGHDPEQALYEAVGADDFGGLRSIAKGLHGRISKAHEGELEPKLDEAGKVAVAGASEDWQQHLEELADVRREREAELGSQAAEEAPAWATDALGAVPEDLVERAAWEAKAGKVAAHREATGWDNDQEPLGPSPGLLNTEQRASWHEAWNALGRPESTPEEHTLTEGQLRNRVAAWEREQGWLPPHVDEEMRATGEQLDRHQQEAALCAVGAEPLEAQAVAATVAVAAVVADLPAVMRDHLLAQLADDMDSAVEMRDRADQAAEKAARMETIMAGLEEVAEARAAALAETAETKAAALRAEAELGRRGVPMEAEPDRVTAEEWLAAHEEAMAAEDEHRTIHEDDLAPGEVFDHELGDFVQVDGVVLEADEQAQEDAQPALAAEPALDIQEAEIVAEEAVERVEQPALEEGAEEVVEAELVDEDLDEAVVQPAAEVEAEAEVEDAVIVEEEAEQGAQWGDQDATLPAGVPPEAAVEVALAEAEAATNEIADRTSLAEAHHQAEVAARAEADAAAYAAAEQAQAAEAAARDAAYEAAAQAEAAQAQADAGASYEYAGAVDE